MQEERWRKIDQIFNQAVLISEDRRKSFVEKSCGDDFDLYAEVIELLEADNQSNHIFDLPLLPLVAQLLDEDLVKLLNRSEFAFYKLQKLLGRGGMSVVFLAEDTRLERLVALKVLPSTVAENHEGVIRFRVEAKAASAISHPNVAHIYEFGVHDGFYFLAMEYIAGKTLRAVLTEEKLDLPQIIDVALQIAKALTAAHEAGIIHRDIKPENVMITSDGLVKVLDFGVAKLGEKRRSKDISSIETLPGLIIGTTAYMSPEQVRGGKLDERTDLWSLGVTLYEMLVGQRPFEGNTVSDIQAAILLKEPNPPEISDQVPEIKNILSKALHKDPTQRYQSAGEMVDELNLLRHKTYEVLNNESKARQTTQNSRKKSFFNRLRGYLLFGGLIVILIALIGGYVFLEKSLNQASPGFLKVQQAIRVTTSGRAVRTALSRNGEWLAYAFEEAGQQGLYLRRNQPSVSASATRTLVAAGDLRFQGVTFSPDERFVYYAAKRTGEVIASLFRIPLTGGEPQKILDNIESPVSFSPDGKQMVFLRLSANDKYESLIIVNADGSNERVFYKREMPEFIPHLAQPAWSPDGQTILSVAGTYGEENKQKIVPVAIHLRDGSATPVFTTPWAEIWQTSWLADGSAFIMTGRTDKTYDNKQLWQVSYPAGEITRLTDDFNDYYGVSVARRNDNEGVQLSTLILERNAQLWRTSLKETNKNAIQLTETGDYGFGVSWQKDNKVVYGSMAEGNPDIWEMSVDGTNKRQLTTDLHPDMYPLATSDGRYVVFISERSGIKSLWRMNRDGSNQILLAQGASSQPFAISPDNEIVYYHSYFDGSSALWRISINGGQPEKVLTGKLEFPAISRNGKFLVSSVQPEGVNQSKIVIRSLENPERVITVLDPIPGINLSASAPTPFKWTSDGGAIVYVVNQKGVGNIWAQPLNNSPAKQLTNFNSSQIYSFDLSPDENQIICSRGEQSRFVTLLYLK